MEFYTWKKWCGGKKQYRHDIPQDVVQAAVKEFIEKGGIVKQMPDEVMVPPMVGAKHAQYETMSSLVVEANNG